MKLTPKQETKSYKDKACVDIDKNVAELLRYQLAEILIK